MEALLEARFASAEAPEMLVGKLADNAKWIEYDKIRLPTADIPLPVRRQNAGLQHQPVFERRSADRTRIARIGHDVLSYHVVGEYPGWKVVGPEIADAIDHLFRSVPQLLVKRLGLRYLNVLDEKRHHISSINALEFQASVRGETLQPPLTVSFRKIQGQRHSAQVSVASPEYVQAPEGTRINVMVDVDIFTPEGCNVSDGDEAREWVEVAHRFLKTEFFRLIPATVVSRLKVE